MILLPPKREVVGGDVTTTTTRSNVTRQKGEEDHDVISPKSVKTVDIIRTNALSEQYGTNVEEELPPLTPSKEFHDPLGVIQRFLNDPSYHANINITENYFIGHSNMSSSSSHDEQYSFSIRVMNTHDYIIQQQQQYRYTINVAESLGNIAEGLLHFGARAA